MSQTQTGRHVPAGVAEVEVILADGPLGAAPPRPAPPGAGAVLVFEGVVRPLENGRTIAALDYEAYQPMAERLLRRLGEELLARHGLIEVIVEHSRGRVPAGACSFRLRVASPHRPEALRAAEEFIDRMKRDVPIWKTAVE